jgi:hypothetical protein
MNSDLMYRDLQREAEQAAFYALKEVYPDAQIKVQVNQDASYQVEIRTPDDRPVDLDHAGGIVYNAIQTWYWGGR